MSLPPPLPPSGPPPLPLYRRWNLGVRLLAGGSVFAVLVGGAVLRKVVQSLGSETRPPVFRSKNTPSDPWIALRWVTNSLPELERRFSEMPPPAKTIEELAAQMREIGQTSGLIYQMVLRGIGWERLIDPKRLEADPYLLETRSMVETARSALSAHRARIEMWPSRVQAIVLQSKLSPADQGAVLGTFGATMSDIKPLMREILDWEDKSLRVAQTLVEWLETNRSLWRAHHGELAFTRRAAEKEFVGLVAQMESYVADQRELQKKMYLLDPPEQPAGVGSESQTPYELRSVR